jgi:hypothetical protein
MFGNISYINYILLHNIYFFHCSVQEHICFSSLYHTYFDNQQLLWVGGIDVKFCLDNIFWCHLVSTEIDSETSDCKMP